MASVNARTRICSPAAFGYEAFVPPDQQELGVPLRAVSSAEGPPDASGAASLWKSIKVGLLRRVIHKGKVVRIWSGRPGESFSSIQQFYEHLAAGGNGSYNVELEHMTEAHGAFLARVAPRAAARAAAGPCSPALIRRFARDLSCSSNAIEGNPCTPEDADRVIDGGEAAAVDEASAEILGHYLVARELLEHPPALDAINIETIEAWHTGLRVAGLPAEKVGKVRREGSPEVIIRSSAHRFVPSKDVPATLEALFSWLRGFALTPHNAIQLAAEAHFRLVHVHPFADGNGRVSRLLMNAVLLAAGLPMTSVMPGLEPVYYAALRAGDRGQGLQLLERIIAEAVWRSLEIADAVEGAAGATSAGAEAACETKESQL